MNERLARWDERRDAPADEKHLFFCECGEPACYERVQLTLAEYAAVRESALRFAVVPGHSFPEAEQIVGERDGYLIVEKYSDVRGIVELTDSRWAPDS